VDRMESLALLRTALEQIKLDGLKTTLPLFRALAYEPAVIKGTVNTAFLESWLETVRIEPA